MPESRYKYLYERLGDHDFQQLVAAVLVAQFPNFTPMALRQADGGRDGLRRDAQDDLLIYQVKWSVTGKERDPVSWLNSTIEAERTNLERLVADGVRHYTLVTNVASTAKPRSGTFDRLNQLLDQHRRALGLKAMECIWREGLNGFVDNAPIELKWTYAEMLAGWDLIRFLIAENVGATTNATTEHKLRRLVRQVAKTQWDSDKLVKFNQSDVDREKVVDLFVDVTADRIATRTAPPRHRALGEVGGAAQHLAANGAAMTLVRGAPGQGKSTLGQYLCQIHRAAFVPEELVPPRLATSRKAGPPRFPLRLDLSDYAQWLAGVDIWAPPEEARRRRPARRPGHQSTIECFLADLMSHDGGGVPLSAQDVHEVFERVPSLVVLDGLDEVGTSTVRTRVVKAIDQFAARAQSYPIPVSVLVTTRPSAGELSEPTPDLFDVLALNPLTPEQRKDYLGKWCAVHGIRGQDARTVRVQFAELSKAPFIGELVGNPMQLTILLELLHRHGAATPAQRTELYDQYVELLLIREANKHPEVVRRFREELKEIVPFLGWYLHARGEENQVAARMPVTDIKAAMRHFLRTYGQSEDVVDKLFEGATDRLWALTSKVDGTYEFDVLSLREYFAARFLYGNAGEDDREFDRAEVVRALLSRPYWLNTARFYGGNATGGAIYELSAAVQDALTDDPTPATCIAAWTLLTDGVFTRRPRVARTVLTALCTDQNLPVLLDALDRHDISALPQLPDLPSDDTDPTWQRLTAAIASDPSLEANPTRVRVLRELLNARTSFARWWMPHLASAAGTATQNDWLALGAACEAAAGADLAVSGLALDDVSAPLLLDTGAVPGRDNDLETELLDMILRGECRGVTSVRSLPAQVAVALCPEMFFTRSGSGFVADDAHASRNRRDAIIKLRATWPEVANVAASRRFKAGQHDSTFPWVTVSTALATTVGRCWLASEIAIIGAASPMRLGYSRHRDRTAFGPSGHPSELLGQCRKNAHDAAWWRDRLDETGDELGQAEWALALWVLAEDAVRAPLSSLWDEVFRALPSRRARVVRTAAAHIARHGWMRGHDNTADPHFNTHTGALPTSHTLRPAQPTASGAPTASSTRTSLPSPSLLTVARERKWLKVDAQPTYR